MLVTHNLVRRCGKSRVVVPELVVLALSEWILIESSATLVKIFIQGLSFDRLYFVSDRMPQAALSAAIVRSRKKLY